MLTHAWQHKHCCVLLFQCEYTVVLLLYIHPTVRHCDWAAVRKMQGTDVEVFSAQPGLIKSPLYEKVDFRKLTTFIMWLVQFTYCMSLQLSCCVLIAGY